MNFDIFVVFIFLGFYVKTGLSSKFQRELVSKTFKRYPNKNLIISPIHLQFSMCKLATIAEGKAKEEIMKSLEFTNDQELTQCYSTFTPIFDTLRKMDTSLWNKILINYSKNIDENFAADSRTKFGVDVEKIGFEYPKRARELLNREVAEETLRRVTGIIEDFEISSQTCVMLVTGAHYKPTWAQRFNPDKTKSRPFYGPNGMSNVMMMEQDVETAFFDARHYKVVLGKLQTSTFMAFIMPSGVRGINGYLDDLAYNPNLMKEIMTNMMQHQQWKIITLFVPKFRINSNLDLTDVFNQTGISEILKKNTTSLKNILKDRNPDEEMFVSKIKQKIILNVDEFGVLRNNHTDSGYEFPGYKEIRGSFSTTMFNVVLDRPFYFAVNMLAPGMNPSDTTPLELFSGVYYGPQ